MDGDREDGGCSRYKKIYSDGTESDWIPIPDPTHPCYALDEDFDDHGFGIFYTERYKRDETQAKCEGIDGDQLWWRHAYLSSFTPILPIECDERRIAAEEFECDVGGLWTLSYRYWRRKRVCIMETLTKNKVHRPSIDRVVLQSEYGLEDFYDIMQQSYGPPSDPGYFLHEALCFKLDKMREEMERKDDIDIISFLKSRKILKPLYEELLSRRPNPYPYEPADAASNKD